MQNKIETHNLAVGYLLWILGFIGLHRFYFGKPISGVIWFLTAGLLLIGWIVDLFLVPSMCRQASGRYTAGPLDYTAAWLLLIFVGVFGVHRLYMKKIISGVLYLLTLGLLGFGVLYDLLTLNSQVDQINRLGLRKSA
jgi:TM2 domain-containing membrane protein YozV